MITKLKKVVFCTCIKTIFFIKLLKALAIMDVHKRLDPWIIGLLDDHKVEKGYFLYMYKKIFLIKLLKASAIMTVQKCLDPWIIGRLDNSWITLFSSGLCT